MALVTVGSTAHYTMRYDDSLSAADGHDRAVALLGVAESDFSLMSDWFGGIALTVGTPIEIDTAPAAGSAPPSRPAPAER